MAEPRHCLVFQNQPERGDPGRKWVDSVVIAGVPITFGQPHRGDGQGHNAETRQAELPEHVGLRAEQFPAHYRVEWKEGPIPAAKVQRIPREAVRRRPEPPSFAELRDDGVAPDDLVEARALHLALHAAGVYPYGTRGSLGEHFDQILNRQKRRARDELNPPKGAPPEKTDDGGLVRRDKAEAKPADAAPDATVDAEEAAPKEPEVIAEPPKLSHRERRQKDLEAMEGKDGLAHLRDICDEYGIPRSGSRTKMIAEILKHEFPHTA